MEESPQSYPASSRRKFRTPPLLPGDIEQPGISLGTFFPSFRGNGSTLSSKKEASSQWLRPARVRRTQCPPLPGR